VIFNTSGAKIYLNGIPRATTLDGAVGVIDTTDIFHTIGNDPKEEGREFTGTIDEVRIYNRTLTSNQILDLYNNRTDLISFNETGIGDKWSACITPNDATGDGSTLCSTNLTIVAAAPNSLPTQGTPILNSTDGNNLTSENLTVYNQSTSDLDNDNLTNIIDWRLNGSSIQSPINNICNIIIIKV